MSAVKKKIVVAVTGATKAGKSEACAYLQKLYPVIDVDCLAHALYKKGSSLYGILKRKYGPVIIKKRRRDKQAHTGRDCFRRQARLLGF
jgi:dephospho-CoA kinase